MFWDSVIAGLMVLTYWETYIAGIEYLAIVLVPIAIVGLVTRRNDSATAAFGCLGMFIFPIFQLVGIIVFTLTLAPIILGIGADAAWTLPWTVITLAPGQFLKLLGVLFLTTFILALIPFINSLDSLGTLVLSAIALMFVVGLIDTINPGFIQEGAEVIPGFWFCVGLLLVGGVMTWIGIMIPAWLITVTHLADDEGMVALVMPFFGAIFGFIPAFMYGAWLGAQLRGGF